MTKRANGEGTIFKDKSFAGRWVGIITLASLDGKRRRKKVYGYSITEVKERLEVEKRVAAVAPSEAGTQTCGEYLNNWLEHVARPSVRVNTFTCYGSTLRIHILPRIGSIPLSDVNGMHIQGVLSSMEKAEASPRMRQLALAVMRVAFRAAGPRPVGMGLIANNPCAGIKAPRVEDKEMKFWTPDQVKVFLKSSKDDRLFALYVLAVLTGLRQGEILGLKWTDLDTNAEGRMTAHVQRTLLEQNGKVYGTNPPKSKAGLRRIVLPDVVRKTLERHAEDMFLEGRAEKAEYVFVSKKGTNLQKTNLIRSFKILSEAAGLPVMRFHDLRHTAVTIMLQQADDLNFIKEQVGHSHINVTLGKYGKLLQGKKSEVADRVDAQFGGEGA